MNPFDLLLREFEQGEVEFDPDKFILVAFTDDELDADRKYIHSIAEIIGYVPLSETPAGETTGYWIAGSIYALRWGRREIRAPGAAKRFAELAARAGAAVPLRLREKFPVRPAGAAATWLTYMWHQQPPTEDDLNVPNVGNGQIRLIWLHPFQDSADAIQRGKLCSSRSTLERASVEGIVGYVSADWLAHKEGIRRQRLSEKAAEGKVRTMTAPRGMIDSTGREIRKLYHKSDAKRHCGVHRGNENPATLRD